MGGLYLAANGSASPEAEVIVSFKVPATSSVSTVIRGRVAWVASEPDPLSEGGFPGFGVEFHEIVGEGLNRARFSELSGDINGLDLHL